jgi:hypothetical protein
VSTAGLPNEPQPGERSECILDLLNIPSRLPPVVVNRLSDPGTFTPCTSLAPNASGSPRLCPPSGAPRCEAWRRARKEGRPVLWLNGWRCIVTSLANLHLVLQLRESLLPLAKCSSLPSPIVFIVLVRSRLWTCRPTGLYRSQLKPEIRFVEAIPTIFLALVVPHLMVLSRRASSRCRGN